MENSIKPTIVADDREVAVIVALRERGIHVISKRLSVADFLITDNAYERKGGHDYTSSIKDGRNEDELSRMVSVYPPPHSKLILENFGAAFETLMNPDSIWGELSKITGDKEHNGLNISVIPTRNVQDTAAFLDAECRRLVKTPQDVPVIRDRPKLLTVLEKQSYFLQGIPHVSPELASAILKTKMTPYDVICNIIRTGIRWTDSDKPKLMIETNLSQLEHIGVMFFLNAREVLGV